MNLIIPEILVNFKSDSDVMNNYSRIKQILTDLSQSNLESSFIQKVNLIVSDLVTVRKDIHHKSYVQLLTSVEKELLQFLKLKHGWYARRYYTDRWLIIGVLGIGLPLGGILVLLSKRNSFLILGLLMGSLLGQWIGHKKDQRIYQEGKQLNIINKKPKWLS